MKESEPFDLGKWLARIVGDDEAFQHMAILMLVAGAIGFGSGGHGFSFALAVLLAAGAFVGYTVDAIITLFRRGVS